MKKYLNNISETLLVNYNVQDCDEFYSVSYTRKIPNGPREEIAEHFRSTGKCVHISEQLHSYLTT